jgi:ribonuclease R
MATKRTRASGSLSITTKGFGFVKTDDGPDVFIDFEHLGTAMDGDIVEAEIFRSSKNNRPAGRVTKVLKRSGRLIVGTFVGTNAGGKVYPEDARLPSSLYIPKAEVARSGLSEHLKRSGKKRSRKEEPNGIVVTAELERWNDPKKKPEGRILQIVGPQDETGMDMKIIALGLGLPLEFPDEVLKEAKRVSDPNMKNESKRRKDLRSEEVIAIDPDGAKDHDDALSVRQLEDGRFEVGIHIADVSAFVPEGGTVDSNARDRATSVYFVRHVLPMLPERLSNGLCSLAPGKDRLAFSLTAILDSLGTVHDFRLHESIIRTRHLLTYGEAEEILKGGKHPAASSVHLLQLLASTLRRKREDRGSINFDFGGKSIILDDDGVPREIHPTEQLASHRLVEEFMLLANRLVAELIAGFKNSPPFIYRVHEQPKQEDVRNLIGILNSVGIPYRLEDTVKPDDYRTILQIIQNFEFRDFVEKIAFYSMTKADYRLKNAGHFGLAFDAYTHFTSPIRRYADLTVHRLLKQYLTVDKNTKGRGKGKRNTRPTTDEADLTEIAKRCSEMEKTATDAEREFRKLKSLEFLTEKVGHVNEGIISGVTSFGMFVELSKYLIEGLVPLSAMKDDYYSFDEENYRFTGRDTGKVYRLGDRITVRIERVSVVDRKADFAIVK